MINVALCEDHGLLRQGLRSVLLQDSEIRLVGEAKNYAEARQILKTQPCDVLLLDLNLPGRDGLELLQDLKEAKDPLKVIVLSLHQAEDYAVRCIRLGAYSYLNKAIDPADLLLAVRTVAQGQPFLLPKVAELMREHMSNPGFERPHDSLSSRELEVLLCIAKGKKLNEIAKELLLSPKTVSVYRKRVLDKLHLLNNVGMTTYAIQRQLI